MSGYAEYREVNLPWLKAVPAHWEIRRNKNIFTEQKEIVGERSADYTLLSLTLNGIIPRDMDGGGKFPESFDKYKIVKNGDMAFCLFDIDETPRTVGMSGYNGMLTGAYTIMRVSNINARFIYYYYLALDNGKMLRPLYTGLRKTININTFQSTKVPVPPRGEQDQIVRFLDWKVSSINKLIRIRKRRIEELEAIKRSSIGYLVMGQTQSIPQRGTAISWVKTIPAHWNEKSLIQVAEEQQIKNAGMVEDNLLSLSYGKIINKDIKTTDGLLPSSFEGYQIVHDGNIILRLTDLQNDHKSLRTGLVTQTGIITSAYTCLKVRCNILPEYLQLQLHVADLCKVFYGMGGGVRQSIGFKEIRKLVIAIPPVEEQQHILDRVHIIEKPINCAIQNSRDIIAELENLKMRLISDTVTGKIDVRGIEIPEYEFVDEDIDNADEVMEQGVNEPLEEE